MNPSTAAATAAVAELVTNGMRHAVLAPGSRSAPLAFALDAAANRNELQLHVRVDERSAAFTAVGLARVAGPTAVVTTSGTAVANLHPAVLEAAHAGVSLLVLTADRPHELRGTGANQTTDQVHVFGSAVRFFADIPAPYGRQGEELDIRHLVSRAFAESAGVRSGRPGPIHLNVAFREPLVPETGDAGVGDAGAGDAEAGDAGMPANDGAGDRAHAGARVHPVHPRALNAAGNAAANAAFQLSDGPRTVVVAGDGAGPAARNLAERGSYPLLAEPSSGARAGRNAITGYRLLLERAELAERIERVVVFGHPTLSRPVHTLLGRRDVEVVVVAPGGDWPDAARNAAHVVAGAEPARSDGDAGWLEEWVAAGNLAREAIAGVLESSPVSGPAIARAVWDSLRTEDALVVGSSNPIRDLDLVAEPREDALVLANRGLAGIDGTLSTAAGVSLASGRHTRVLVGDLTFLHDTGGLLLGPGEERPRLQIVVVNDDGGGIFTLLEPGEPQHADAFERLFGTPHGVDLAALCAAYGVRHTRVADRAALRRELADPPPGRSMVEVRVERSAHRALHADIRSAVGSALKGNDVGSR
ncbi:2-succinyl-5-enolpyruvyl-6-hydroxy-3-cyclohexene-1-carboxylic-acid synthase [Phytoactinopolyspora halophila]|uniref:2-succinyl-5-enolpyruvyl-6-hydroxy-3- cyclohexene-1-carboxylic-acid synthase n=1 Tax=Phytoactinopolyspora halophila TaxID=1981511 RepID=UPI001B8CF896|nr:2-succinyl-5-enolpyruvyl-6-hydroxy-3-cyclohexene-1-carboxylic-acid synthase [Phytoactinopolyspora halophila]